MGSWLLDVNPPAVLGKSWCMTDFRWVLSFGKLLHDVLNADHLAGLLEPYQRRAMVSGLSGDGGSVLD